jgi:hypothetical protein
MFEGTTTGIQVATLIVAILAVVASIGGILVSSHLSSRAEHRSWKRDLRSQYYSALDDEVQTLKLMLGQSPPPTRDQKLAAFYRLYPLIANVTTYGTVSVRDAAFTMFKELSILVVIDSLASGQADEIDTAITNYREAVRKSLRFDDN